MELRNGYYSLYYKCPQCSNRFTLHDAEMMDAINEAGMFHLPRIDGFIANDKNNKIIYTKRRKVDFNNENDV